MKDLSSASAPARQSGAATVTVYPDGPLVLRGEFAVVGVDGDEFESGRMVALCRCGRSAVKPWCDGSHKRGPMVSESPD